MKLKTLSLFSLVAMALVLVSTSANARTTFSVFGDANMHVIKTSPTQAGTTDPSASLGFGGGVGLEFGLSSMVGLSIEAIYEMNKMKQTSAGTEFTFSTTQLLFPVAARIWLNSGFNFLVGGYYAMAMGKIKVDPAVLGVSEFEYSDPTFGSKKSDYGAVLGLGVNIPMSSMSFFIDARYYLGLANLDSPTVAGQSTKTSNIQGLVGLRFGGKK